MKQYPLKFMPGDKWWSKKAGAKLMSDLVVFSICSIFSEIPLDFHESI